jgi:hypothetical protein
MNDQVCGLCGIVVVDGSYRFSYRSNQPVHKDAVYTRVCKSAINAQLRREAEGETDLEPIALHKCINQNGKYDKRYRWIANPQEKV